MTNLMKPAIVGLRQAISKSQRIQHVISGFYIYHQDIYNMMRPSSSSITSETTLDLSMLPSLTLYGDLNMRPFRNAWMLEELQLPYKHIPCKPWSRTAKSINPLGKIPALLVDYQKGTTNDKVLRFVVLESAAINTFLGDLSREYTKFNKNEAVACPSLVPPPGTIHRARYESLVSFMMTELDAQSLWIHRKHGDLFNVFGEAPIAVREAKRQFDNSLKVMEDELCIGSDGECSYLISGGFSAVDILFVHCCSWAEHIGWLVKKEENEIDDIFYELKFPNGNKDEKSFAMKPVVMSRKLEKYLNMCHSRPAYKQANRLNENEMRKERKQESKL